MAMFSIPKIQKLAGICICTSESRVGKTIHPTGKVLDRRMESESISTTRRSFSHAEAAFWYSGCHLPLCALPLQSIEGIVQSCARVCHWESEPHLVKAVLRY